MPKRPWTDLSKTILAFLAANLLFGLGTIAVMPPFEGVDEISHFSRMKSVAYAPQKTVLSLGEEEAKPDHIAADVFDYSRHAPMPYWWVDHDWIHNVDQFKDYMSYHDFFEQPLRSDIYEKVYRRTPLSAEYVASPQINPEYQHPPLYYVVMAPVVKFLADHVSMVTSQFVLRCLSYLMAFIGFCIGIAATGSYVMRTPQPGLEKILAFGVFYPFLTPVFFWEFGHLTNDAICLFISGSMWAALLWHMRSPRSDAWIYLGLLIGFSWLAKAFMIPVTFGMILFLALYQFFVVRKSIEKSLFWWFPALGTTCFAFLVGGPFYLLNYLHSGSLGAGAFSKALEDKNVLTLLMEHFSWPIFAHDLWVVFSSSIWLFGTWSVILIGEKLYLFFAVIAAAVFLFCFYAARKKSIISLSWLPLWIVGPMAGGLAAHILVMMILGNEKTVTLGVYLQVLAPAYALIFGLGLQQATQFRWIQKAVLPLCGLAVLVDFYIAYAHMAIFAGCAVPPTKKYIIPLSAVNDCFGQFPRITERLDVLAWPTMAYMSYGFSFLFVFFGLWSLHNLLKKSYQN